MIALSVLLLATGAEAALPPPITIDPCVQVDTEEVRRLVEIELGTWHGRTALERLDVAVACAAEGQEVRLTDRARGRVTVRGIDLSASGGKDRDAKARELALAIAELIRRVDLEQASEPSAPSVAPPPEPTPLEEPARVEPAPPSWRVEVGAHAIASGWTGGELLFGADLSGRVHLGRFLIAELELGGRKTRSTALASGKLSGYGLASGVGLALDATPGWRRAGVSFGARLGGDWLRYTAVSGAGASYGGGDAGVVSVAGTTTAFVALSGPFSATFRAAVGGALHSIQIRDNGRAISGARGMMLSSALGVAARF